MNFVTVRIAKTTALEYLTGKRELLIPEGSRLVSFWLDACERLVLKLEHPSFPPVKPGTRVPRIETRFRSIGP